MPNRILLFVLCLMAPILHARSQNRLSLQLQDDPKPVEILTHQVALEWETNTPAVAEAFYSYSTPSHSFHFKNREKTTRHRLSIPMQGPSTLAYVTPFHVSGSDTLWCAPMTLMSRSASSGDIRVYFTRPVDHSVATGPLAVFLNNTAGDTVVALINRAKKSIDLAIYNFNIDAIAYALNQAKARGVAVRVIYNGSSTNSSILVLQGIPVLASPTSGSYSIMHNKFLVIDCDTDNPNDALLLTGSMNFTSNQVSTDANNFLIIQDKSLALAYRMEFEEMWGSSGPSPNASASRFGPFKTNNTPHYFNIGGRPVESWFSPSDGVNAKIAGAINSAGTSLFVPTNLITRNDLGDAIGKRRQAGVLTRVVVDNEGTCSASVVQTLVAALGTSFRESGESGIMHSKVLIADAINIDSDPLVLTGSHNWSNNAETKNDENTLIIRDATIANLYYQDFNQRFKTAVIIGSNPALDLGPDITLCAGQTLWIDAGKGFSSYSWSIGGFGSMVAVDTTGIGTGSITIGCTVTGSSGTSSDQITITFEQCTGLWESPRIKSLRVWPNPTRGECRVALPVQNHAKGAGVSVYNSNGMLMFTRQIQTAAESLSLDLSPYPPGLYLIRVQAGSVHFLARVVRQ